MQPVNHQGQRLALFLHTRPLHQLGQRLMAISIVGAALQYFGEWQMEVG